VPRHDVFDRSPEKQRETRVFSGLEMIRLATVRLASASPGPADPTLAHVTQDDLGDSYSLEA
jgi:hypothetical protein